MQIFNTPLKYPKLKRQFLSFVSPPNIPALIGIVLSAAVLGLIVSFDPYLATYVPESIWSMVFLYYFPYKVTLVTAVSLIILGLIALGISKAREKKDIIIVLFVSSMQLHSFGAGGLDPQDILVIILFASIFAQALADPNFNFKLPLVMYFALAMGILDLPNATIDNPGHFVIGLIKYMKSAIIPLILVHILITERLIRVFINTFLIVAFISACIGIAQVIIYSLTGIAYVFVDELSEALKPTPWGMMLRAHGLMPETHGLMSFLLIALPFSLYFLAKSKSSLHKLIFVTLTVTLLSGIVLTWSYSGVIGAGIVLGLFPIFIWPNKSIHYILALLMIPVFLYFTDLITDIINIIKGEYSMSTGIFQRKSLTLWTIEELMRNPWIGRGYDTVRFFSGNYWQRPVHNAYLEAWTSIGPIGFIIFTTMMLTFTTSTLILGFSGSSEQNIRLRMVALLLVAFMFVMIAEPMMFGGITWVLLGFSQALILTYGCERVKLGTTRDRRSEQST